MSAQFERTIGDLWASLSLPAPIFSERPTIILTVETTNVLLEESRDGRHINLSSSAGHLARDPISRSMQIHDLLASNLASLTSLAATVSIEDTGTTEAEVIVKAVYPYRIGKIGALTTAVQSVLALAQAHVMKLRGSSARPTGYRSSQAERNLALQEAHSLIFRP